MQEQKRKAGQAENKAKTILDVNPIFPRMRRNLLQAEHLLEPGLPKCKVYVGRKMTETGVSNRLWVVIDVCQSYCK